MAVPPEGDGMSEVRPFLVRCPVCLSLIANVVAASGTSILMPPHAYQPGYKCMGSGVEAILIGRGDVIEGGVVPAQSPPETPGQWGTR